MAVRSMSFSLLEIIGWQLLQMRKATIAIVLPSCPVILFPICGGVQGTGLSSLNTNGLS
jgi:hypothetical protein